LENSGKQSKTYAHLMIPSTNKLDPEKNKKRPALSRLER